MNGPAYVGLHRSGELARRATVLRGRLTACDLCPRRCGVNRLLDEVGACGIGGQALVASASPHFGEEAPLVGRNGSGTIFFAGCNLRCLFCQNADISMAPVGRSATPEALAEVMLGLQRMGCHNINLVTPTHVVPQILEALDLAAAGGLRVPLVYNTGGYDSFEVVGVLDGVVDIYMPDCKFADDEVARSFCDAADYPEVNRAVVREMHRQVGDLEVGSDGIAVRGLLVRHLVMPNGLAGTERLMEWIAAELSQKTHVNLMDQYRPCHLAHRIAGIDRRVSDDEMRAARAAAKRAGLA